MWTFGQSRFDHFDAALAVDDRLTT